MSTQFSKSLRLAAQIEYFVTIFIVFHLILWTIFPALIRYNLPLDSIEGTLWGHQLEWGYDKNPFLNGWLSALAVYISKPSGWMMYFFSQLSVASCLWVVWQLGKKILTPLYAFIAVLLLEGVQYFNFHAIDFNDNTLELGLWAFSTYFFYQALTNSRNRNWFATGIFSAFALMAKYYTLILLLAMFLFLIIPKYNRKHLLSRGPYLCLSIFVSIILPHVIWLFFHDFITIKYVFARASSPPSLFNHIYFPVQFFWQQVQVFLPALGLFALLLIGKKPIFTTHKIRMSSFDKAFLFYIGVGPLLLTLLLSLLLGIKLRAGWGMPLLSFSTIILLALLQPNLTQAKVYRFIITIIVFMGVLLTGYTLSLIDSSDASSANFPGKEIASTITNEWNQKYHTKLDYVAGSRWLGGNISFYSKDHPAVFVEWEKNRAPWIDIESLKNKGAVFVWDITGHESLPLEIQKEFSNLEPAKVMRFALHRNKRNLPPAEIGVAFLPPSK